MNGERARARDEAEMKIAALVGAHVTGGCGVKAADADVGRAPQKSTPVFFTGEAVPSAAASSRLRAFLTVYAASFPAEDVGRE